ncbi:sigma-70 family RNA polymerase sigma factor [Thalassospira australica]|uniref:sigma-70 family RNA polymerase sigma factor n=1 Tax=Thalassospira australica TaxID=1528106 RepID=UPI00051A45B4|nr:sigma-70 family RNA polymerase sigma factor [Thalassospira australica]
MKLNTKTQTTADWQALKTGLHRFVLSRVPKDDADDVVSEILETIIRNRDSLRDAANPSAWIFAIARNKVADFYRHRGRERTLHHALNNDPTLSDQDQQHDQPGLHDCIISFIGRLSPSDQNILEEIDMNGTRQTDFASRNVIALPTVKSRVQRARNRLRNRLIACCPHQRLGSDGDRADDTTCCGPRTEMTAFSSS